MMKNKLIGALLSVAVLSSSAAFALDIEPKFYVGGELAGVKRAVNDKVSTNLDVPANNTMQDSLKDGKVVAKKRGNEMGLFVGSRLNENLGVELGYGVQKAKNTTVDVKNADATQTLKGSFRQKSTNIYADVLGYLPINESVDVIGSVGLGRLATKSTGEVEFNNAGVKSNIKGKSSSKVGYRLGAGAQYKFNENVGARLMARFQKGNKIVKHTASLGLGLFYQF